MVHVKDRERKFKNMQVLQRQLKGEYITYFGY